MSHEGRRGGAGVGAAGHTINSVVAAAGRQKVCWHVGGAQLLLPQGRLSVYRQLLCMLWRHGREACWGDFGEHYASSRLVGGV
jgi:hypothetical protein